MALKSVLVNALVLKKKDFGLERLEQTVGANKVAA